MNSLVRFEQGTQAQYDALTTKDDDVLYFLTDTKRIFKGSIEYTKTAKVVAGLPSTSSGEFGVIYINTSDNIPYVFNGTGYTAIIKAYSTTIDSSTATDNTIPTTKAVKEYVDANKTTISGIVTDIGYNQSEGKIDLYKDNGSNSSKTLQLTGVAHNPTYESSSRKITIPVFGENDLVIELGVDAFVQEGSYNSTDKTIELTLTNGQEVVIPAGDLVKEYLAGNTASINLSIDSSTNTFTGNVNISSETGNALQLKDDGLYVPEGGDTLVRNSIS